MKVLYEKNLQIKTRHITSPTFEKKYFCGGCTAEIEHKNSVCPRCGAENIRSWGYTTKVMYPTRVTITENGDKLFLNTFENKVCLHNGKFRFAKYIYCISFNFATGQAYYLPVVNGKTKTRLKKKGNSIKNISYAPHHIDAILPPSRFSEAFKDIIDVFKNKAKNYISYEDEMKRLDDTISDGTYIAETLLSLTKHKFHNSSTSSLYELCSYYNYGCDFDIGYPKEARKFFLKPNSKNNIEKSLSAKIRRHYMTVEEKTFGENIDPQRIKEIKTKSTVRFHKDLWSVFSKNFQDLSSGYIIGTLKLDNQPKILLAAKNLSTIDQYIDPTVMQMILVGKIAQIVKLYDDETSAVRRIMNLSTAKCSMPMSFFGDIVRMLQRIKEHNIDIRPFIKFNNFMEVHDKVVEAYNLVRFENRKIHITEKEKSLNETLGDYTFTVCDETDQLTNIGSEMHICVGSYGDRAVEKDCLIVKGELNGSLFTCIEVRNNALIQVKGYCNKRLSDEDQEVVKAWAKQKKIEFESCWDLQGQMHACQF